MEDWRLTNIIRNAYVNAFNAEDPERRDKAGKDFDDWRQSIWEDGFGAGDNGE